jgi:hypothetical protein
MNTDNGSYASCVFVDGCMVLVGDLIASLVVVIGLVMVVVVVTVVGLVAVVVICIITTPWFGLLVWLSFVVAIVIVVVTATVVVVVVYKYYHYSLRVTVLSSTDYYQEEKTVTNGHLSKTICPVAEVGEVGVATDTGRLNKHIEGDAETHATDNSKLAPGKTPSKDNYYAQVCH